jgi:integrase
VNGTGIRQLLDNPKMAVTGKRLYRDLDKEVVRYAAFVATAKEADIDDSATWVFWDSKIAGLRVQFGRHKISFSYFKQHKVHGNRSTTSLTLGHYPEMTVKAARDAALIEAGRIAAKRLRPGKRAAVKFEAAFNEYLSHLESKAKRKGKEPTWHNRVVSLGKMLLPEFAKWPLSDLSNNPGHVRDVHKTMTRDHGPVVANRAMQVLRACYRHAAKLNRNLPPPLPTSAVVWNSEEAAEKGVFDFPAWAKAWRKIPSPVRRGYTLALLLTGCRRTELATLLRVDVDSRSRTFLLRNIKSRGEKRRDVRRPLSHPIVRAFKMADGADDVLVFPGCFHNPARDKLPAHGHSLRHAYESIMVELKVDPLLRKILMGHAIGRDDVTEGYSSQKMLGRVLREEQARISKRIVTLLGQA